MKGEKVMKTNIKYIFAFLMLFGMSASQQAWGGMYLEYGGKTYNPGEQITIYADLEGEDIIDGYLSGIELKNSSGWTYSANTCASGKNYGYMDASISHSNVWISTNITGCYNAQYGTQNLALYYMTEAVGVYDGTLTITQSNYASGTVLQTGSFPVRLICYDSDASPSTISFSVGYGSAPTSLSNTSNPYITLPTIPALCSEATAAGWTPFGWATAAVPTNSSSALIVGKPGENYYPDASRTLYAVYRKGGTTLTSSTVFTRKSSQGTGDASKMPTSGYVLLTQATSGQFAISNTLLLNGLANYYVRFPGTTGYQPSYNSGDNTMTTDSATLVWEVSSVTEGSPSTKYFMFKNVASGKYLGLASTTSAAFYDNVCDNAKWSVDGTTTDGYYFKNKAIEYILTNNASVGGWRGAASADGSKSNVHVWTQMSVTSSGSKYQSSMPLCGYTVTYDANDATSGTAPTDATVYTSGATVTVLGNTGSLARTGYTFSGWNTKANGTGTDRAVSATFSITEEVTLYAKWTPKEYTVNLNKDGGSGGSTSVTATYDAAMPSAGSAPTFSGYTFGGYYTQEAGSGTQYYNATPASAHKWDIDTDPSTLYAKWTQTVTLNKNNSDGGSTAGSVSAIYHGGIASFSAATRTGWVCTGYWDATSGGNMIISSTGVLQSYIVARKDYINSSGKWAHAGATTLYAQWEAKTTTVTLNANGGVGDDQTVTATYGSAMPLTTTSSTAIVVPTREGYDFLGYWDASSGGNQYYNYSGSPTPSLSSNANWNKEDATKTLYAHWQKKRFNMSVSSNDKVTILATDEEDGTEVSEGANRNVLYHNMVELTYSSVSTGYFWGGWNITRNSDSEDVTDAVVTEIAGHYYLEMPAYNVTVDANLYTNAKAWCPVITLELSEGSTPILVTSIGGQSVKAVRTLHLTVSGAATPAAEVTISGDDLEFYDGTTKITSSNLTCSSYALDKTITVAYKPTSYVNETWAEPDITVSCSGTEITVSDLVNARCLPDNGSGDGQGFVIAAKVGDEWLALPASMSAGAQDGLPITVDNSSDPTRATKAPTSARYNMYNVYTSTGANDRHKTYGTYAYLAGSGTKALKAAASGTNISLGANVTPGTYGGSAANPELIEWLLSTTDKKNYTLTNNGRSAQLKYYTTHGKFGMYTYGSQVITEFRLLPANFYTEAPMQVLEWKAKSVVVMYTGSETTATTKVGSNSASSSQTLSTHKLTHGIYELTTDQALSSNDGAALEIAFGDGTTKKIVEIPLIITGATTATDGHAGQDVIICKNGKLTAASTKYDYFNIYVYGGGKLKIASGTSLGVNNIILRAGGISTNGSGGSATYEYVYPQVELGGTLTSTADSIQYEYITDYDHWYHLCLPFNAPLRSIHYPQEYYGDNVTAENSGSWIIKRYDGATRATGEYNAWKDIEKDDPAKTEVTAGYGYIFWGAPKKVSVGGAAKERQTWGIQRMTMSIAADEAKTAENADKNVTGLAAHSGAGSVNDQGWNLVGNPYMVNLTAFSSDNLKQGQLIHSDAVPWDGKWKNDGAGTRYVTIPNNHFDTYEAKTTATASGAGDFMPGRVFFVQIDKGTTLTFEATNRAALAPAWHRNAEAEQTVDIETGIVMSSETLADEVNFWIKDGKTEAYEFNADYPKTPNKTDFNIYGVHQSGNLSWVAISPAIAEGDMAIGYQVPAAGDYTLSLSEKYIAEDIESVFVTDHGVSPELTTDLMVNTYTFTVHQAETNNERFTVSIKVREKDNTPTDIGNSTVETHAVKFIRDDKMYILRNGLLYDATGKRVTEINK